MNNKQNLSNGCKALFLSISLLMVGCAQQSQLHHDITLEADGSYEVMGQHYTPLKNARGFSQTGIASWYGPNFHGQKTANGEIFDMHDLTAAHKLLPLPSYVEVTNLKNQKRVTVRVNDRGPFHDGRILDLSFAAATALDLVGPGTGEIKLRVLSPEEIQQLTNTTHYPKLYIQVGAFSNPVLADSYADRLQKLTEQSTFKMPIEQAGKLLYKVRIGPLADMSQAHAVQQLLVRLNLNKGFVMQE